MRSGKARVGLILGLVFLVLAGLVWWFFVDEREEQALERTSREVADDGFVEIVSVVYPEVGGPLEVRFRVRSEDFDSEQVTVKMALYVLSPSGYELCSPQRHEFNWGSWVDPVSKQEQLMLVVEPASFFDRVEVELEYEGRLIERATYDWSQG